MDRRREEGRMRRRRRRRKRQIRGMKRRHEATTYSMGQIEGITNVSGGNGGENRDEDGYGDDVWYRDNLLKFSVLGGGALYPRTVLIFVHPPTGLDCHVVSSHQFLFPVPIPLIMPQRRRTFARFLVLWRSQKKMVRVWEGVEKVQ